MKKSDTSDTKKKEEMVATLEKALGVVTTACRIVGISRDTHYRWMKNDEEYKIAVDDLSNVALDFAESKLHKLIENENATAIIFFLKTKGKKRGYVEGEVETERPYEQTEFLNEPED
jgi:hypothetical protein